MDDLILDDIQEEGRLVSLAEVKVMLEKAQEGREEMTYEQKIAMEHSRRFARVDHKAAEKIIAGVKKILPEADNKFAFRVADLLPQHADDVLAIFQKSRMELDDSHVEAIIAVVDENYVA